MTNQVYITNTSKYLPNNPVSNDEMEEYLGLINGTPSKSKRIVLRNNGIKQRYYTLSKGGVSTHTNSEITALAIKDLVNNNLEALTSIELLSCGTSSPDQMMPSHGVMVHGWLPESKSMEVVSPSGVCCAGMHAFKYAYMAVKLGDVDRAIATGSERFSPLLKSDVFEEEAHKLSQLESNPYIGFEKDFLRWMLSDGAAAFLLTNKPNESGLSLRVEWIDGVSYANVLDACMYMGCDKPNGKDLKSFMDYTPEEITDRSIFSIKQDVKLLGEYIVAMGYDKLKATFDKRGVKVTDIDYFLPHISSEFFRSKIAEKLIEHDLHIPMEKWFTNLSTVGNVGAASVYLMVDELFKSGKLKKGQKIFLLVPESGRFSYMFAYLTVC